MSEEKEKEREYFALQARVSLRTEKMVKYLAVDDGSIGKTIERLVEQGDTSLNISIQDGDSIYINKAGVFYVTGEVRTPGSYKHEDNPTVLKAFTLAGGMTDHAAPGRTRIIRIIDGKEVILKKVAMDEPVLPDDVIVVPETYF